MVARGQVPVTAGPKIQGTHPKEVEWFSVSIVEAVTWKYALWPDGGDLVKSTEQEKMATTFLVRPSC